MGKFEGPYVRSNTADVLVSILKNGICHCFHAEQCLSIEEDSPVVSLLSGEEIKAADSLVFITSDGMVKRTAASDIVTGKDLQEIIKLKKDAYIIGAHVIGQNSEIILVTKEKMGIRFKVEDLPLTGRIGIGVLGIKLKVNDRVLESYTEKDSDLIKTKGIEDLKVQKRAGKGTQLKEYR
jgi:DNA gyrase/topoisomerase IV subunit A